MQNPIDDTIPSDTRRQWLLAARTGADSARGGASRQRHAHSGARGRSAATQRLPSELHAHRSRAAVAAAAAEAGRPAGRLESERHGRAAAERVPAARAVLRDDDARSGRRAARRLVATAADDGRAGSGCAAGRCVAGDVPLGVPPGAHDDVRRPAGQDAGVDVHGAVGGVGAGVDVLKRTGRGW